MEIDYRQNFHLPTRPTTQTRNICLSLLHRLLELLHHFLEFLDCLL
jgi:hypothetical protein